MTFKAFPAGGKLGAYCSISGKDGSIVGPSYPLKEWLKWVKEEKDKEKYGEDHLFTIWVRGKGTLRVSFEAFGKSEDGKTVQVENPEPFTVRVDSDTWVRYRHVVQKDPDITMLHPAVSAPEGKTDFDELILWPAEPAQVLLIEEQERLYGRGALIENMEKLRADETFFAWAAEFESAVKVFLEKAGSIDEKVFQSIEEMIAGLSPYALTKGITAVEAMRYNDIIALTRVLKRLAGEAIGEPVPITAKEVAASPAISYKLGVRPARRGKVTITDIRSNKVRYDENETANTTAIIVNKGESAVNGTLIARMILDLDTARKITRAAFSVAPGQEKKWSFSYDVGPETYGRAIEVQFVDNKGKILDAWQEYYAVAAEWFRVHQHTHYGWPHTKLYEINPWVTYFNQKHYFASEPTDVGVHDFDAEVIISGQAGYHINRSARQAQINANRRIGINSTFYQNAGFCGQMGYEEMRKHPEYVLYDENGQFGVDPVYGGYPNPMELASPIEIGPKRKEMKIKPYLDRQYTPWQHCLANRANEDAVIFQANCVKEYAKLKGFAGIFLDGSMGVWKGYSYDGASNVPSGKYEDIVRLNARNHRIFSEIVKKDNPNFGTWYNWSERGAVSGRMRGRTDVLGSGVEGDVNDDSIRTALDYKNVMILDESMGIFRPGAGELGYPAKHLDHLIVQRDFVVQKYEGNTLTGYISAPLKAEEPGQSKWGWPTINYFTAQLIAAQIHHAGEFWPSYRPAFQFMTRYSRFIWARDIKVVPVDEVEKLIELESPEKIWWKRLVYNRKTKDGYDLIVHLVRIPPTEKWDINWVAEPEALEGVKIAADIGSGKLQSAQACRPYHFEEPQQVVQKELDASSDTGKLTVEIPPFRYHTMVVFGVEEE